LGGIRFRRQHPIGAYIVDFYCPSARLAVEIDGYSHADALARDAKRTAFLAAQDVRVIRFSNDEVLKKLDEVVYRIACEIGIEM
jgi:very-short-patch-repair endonuclease